MSMINKIYDVSINFFSGWYKCDITTLVGKCWNIVLLVYILKLPWDKCQLNYTFGKYVKHYQRSKIVHHFDFEKRNHINKLHNNYLLDSFYEVLFSSD